MDQNVQPESNESERHGRQNEPDKDITGAIGKTASSGCEQQEQAERNTENRAELLPSGVSRPLQDVGRRARRYVRWLDKHDGVVTALATVVIAYLTYSLATDSARQAEILQGTLRAIEGQLEVMREDLRPYIKIRTVVDGSIEFNEGGTILPVRYEVSNVGKTPAFDVRIIAVPYTGKSPYDGSLLKDQIAACEILPKRALIEGEQSVVVFPGEKIDWEKRLGTSIPVFGKSQVDHISRYEDDKNVMQFWFFVCADYTFGSKREHRQIGYIYHAVRGFDGGGGIAYSPTISVGQTVPANRIRLESKPSASSVTN